MKHKATIIGIMVILVMIFSNCTRQSGFPVLKGSYLGQKPPGDVPELFAPGIVSSVYLEHSSAVFTPDGKELFWSREINVGQTPRIIVVLHMKQENGVWIRPELAPFNFNEAAYNHINSISPDGKRLYYFSWSEEKGRKVWVVDKTENGWGEPRLIRLNTIDNPGNTANEVHETRNGNLYLTGTLESMQQGYGIVRSKFVDGKYLFFIGYSNTYNEDEIFEKKYTYAELIEIQESIFNGLGNIYWVDTSFIEELNPNNQK